MNFLEKHGKLVAMSLCGAAILPAASLVKAQETTPGWHGKKFMNLDQKPARGWQEIQGESYYFDEADGDLDEAKTKAGTTAKVAVKSIGNVKEQVTRSVAENIQETAAAQPVLPAAQALFTPVEAVQPEPVVQEAAPAPAAEEAPVVETVVEAAPEVVMEAEIPAVEEEAPAADVVAEEVLSMPVVMESAEQYLGPAAGPAAEEEAAADEAALQAQAEAEAAAQAQAEADAAYQAQLEAEAAAQAQAEAEAAYQAQLEAEAAAQAQAEAEAAYQAQLEAEAAAQAEAEAQAAAQAQAEAEAAAAAQAAAEAAAAQAAAQANPYADLNQSIAQSALGLVGTTDGLQCTEVVQLALAGAGVSDAMTLWPDEYAGVYGEYTDTPEAGNLIYYNNGGRGVDHIAVYIGDGQAVHGNFITAEGESKTVIYAAEYPTAAAPQYIQVYR